MVNERDFEELDALLKKAYREQQLDALEEARLRQILTREMASAYTMQWDELLRFGALVGGLHLFKQWLRERNTHQQANA